MFFETTQQPSKQRFLKSILLVGGAFTAGYASAKLLKHKQNGYARYLGELEKWVEARYEQLQERLSIPFHQSVEVYSVIQESVRKMWNLTKDSVGAEADEFKSLQSGIEDEFNHMKRRIHKIVNPPASLVEYLEEFYKDLKMKLGRK